MALVGVATFLVALAPRLLGYASAGGNRIFLTQILGVHDIPPYAELLRESANGSWLAGERVIGGPHSQYLFYLPYILAGHLLGGLHLDPITMLFVLWIAASIFCLIACCWHQFD